jgi:hypothetical protein
MLKWALRKYPEQTVKVLIAALKVKEAIKGKVKV